MHRHGHGEGRRKWLDAAHLGRERLVQECSQCYRQQHHLPKVVTFMSC